MSTSLTPVATRRMLLSRGAAAAFGAIVAGSLEGESARAQNTTTQAASGAGNSDASVIASLLQVEQAVSVAYRIVLASGRLGARTVRRLRTPYAQQRVHVRMLSSQLATLQPGAFVSPQSTAAARQLLASHHLTTSFYVPYRARCPEAACRRRRGGDRGQLQGDVAADVGVAAASDRRDDGQRRPAPGGDRRTALPHRHHARAARPVRPGHALIRTRPSAQLD